MDTQWFEDALRNAGLTQADLARHLALPPSAVSRMLRGTRNMKLQEAVQTAQLLGVSQDEVVRRASDTEALAPSAGGRRGRPPRASQTPVSVGPIWRDTIPITSTRSTTSAGSPDGFTPRPANLTGVRGAYAIYVSDESLAPRYEPGWLLHVHPSKPPTRGRDVVITRTDETVLIRQYVGWEDDTLVLRQLNPNQTMRVPRAEVAACHLIVGVDQEG